MDELDLKQEEGNIMVNPELIAAALAVVRNGGVDVGHVEIAEYPGIFVARSNGHELQAIHFFKEDGVKFVLGPLKK